MNTEEVAAFVKQLDLNDLPGEVVERAKLCVMDTVGAMLGGLNARSSSTAREVAAAIGGRGEASLFGAEIKASSVQAAFANCVAASALDMDDGHTLGGHPGSVVVPSALAVGEAQRASGKALLEAIIAGYEITIRAINVVSGPGFGTGTGGTYGVVAASAKILGCSERQIAHALGIASIHAPITSPVSIWSTGYMGKECIGWAAITGVEAALLAQHGFTGPSTFFDTDGARGTSIDSLGTTFEILGVYFKPHASCRWTHTAIDATLALMEENSLAADDISKITVATRERSAELKSTRPISIEQAQYSYPFVLGAVLAYGNQGPGSITEDKLSDPAILKQADKVTTAVEPALASERWPARVIIQTTDGRRFERQKLIPRGDPEEPMSRDELRTKFISLSAPVIGQDHAKSVVEIVDGLEELDDIHELTSLLATNAPVSAR